MVRFTSQFEPDYKKGETCKTKVGAGTNHRNGSGQPATQRLPASPPQRCQKGFVGHCVVLGLVERESAPSQSLTQLKLQRSTEAPAMSSCGGFKSQSRMLPRATRREVASAADFRALFAPHGLLLVKRCCGHTDLSLSGWGDEPRHRLAALTQAHPEMVASTWTLEHSRENSGPERNSTREHSGRTAARGGKATAKRRRTSEPTASDVPSESTKALPPDKQAAKLLDTGAPKSSWYASFVVQHDEEALSALLSSLPFAVAPAHGLRHLHCAWIFFGQNLDGAGDLAGRDEHTDKVSHDGTWHLQLAGSKRWRVRPSDELLAECPELPAVGYDVVCEAGDLFVINTRLWWHQTSIPETEAAQDGLSLSVARDFTFISHTEDSASSAGRDTEAEAGCDMTNLDGLFATDDIEADTIILKQSDMGAGELEIEVSEDPNCALVEVENEVVLVSKRDIRAGEWFSVADEDDSSAVDD